MPAISTQNFTSGLMQGFDFVDDRIRQRRQDEQRQQAIEGAELDRQITRDRLDRQEQRAIAAEDEARAYRAEERDYRRSQDERANRREDRRDRMAEDSNKRAWAAERRAAMSEQRKERDIKRAELVAKADYYWRALEGGADVFPAQLDAELRAAGLEQYSPYTLLDPQAVSRYQRADRVLQQLGTGNMAYLNSPEGLEDVNELYRDQIQEGIGEFVAPMGASVTSKRIVGMKAAPGGKFVTEVEVELDNGKRYVAPLTINRSSDPNDPVSLTDAGVAMDDLAGRSALARMAQNPQYRDRIARARQIAFGSQATAGMGKSPPADAQMIEYLQQRGGMSFDDARDMVMQSKNNPQKAALDFAGKILAAQGDYADNPLTPAQAFEEAQRILSGAGQKPAASMEQQPAAAAPTAAAPATIQEGQTARNPQTGERIVFRGGQWQPL